MDMDAKEYCDNMWVQLTIWKEELYAVLKIAENFPDQDREIVAPQLASMMLLIDELGKKIDQFKRVCPLTLEVKEMKKHAAAR
jgi:hypothetical protein